MKPLVDLLIGQKIVEVSPAKDEHFDVIGWDEEAENYVAIYLENGAVLLASRDEEGNGPGEIFCLTRKGLGKNWNVLSLLPFSPGAR